MFVHRICATVVLFAVTSSLTVGAPTITAGDVTIASGQSVSVEVAGDISGESTFGVSILAEIVPRAGATGTVVFTPAPPVDVVQLGDPWPAAGTFDPFDTDETGSLTLNGSVDDNGTFVAEPVTFSGPLTALPIQASADAEGVWDVVLSTSVGDSSWEGLATTRVPGTITVTSTTSIPTVSAWGAVILALLLVGVGSVLIKRRQRA